MKQTSFHNSFTRSLTALFLLVFSSVSASAQYYMDIYQKGGQKLQFAVSAIDSVRFSSPSELNPNQSDPQSSDSLLESGLYLGVIGFNQQLYTHPITSLDAVTKSSFDSFIDNLSMKNGTILCYSIEQAINALHSTAMPENLSTVAIVTFTDGLDQGSLMMSYDYDTDVEYLAALKTLIQSSSIGGVSLTAHSIGLRGSDVTSSADIQKFRSTLKQLASTDANATEVTNMDEVNTRFQEIAEQLNTQINLQNVAIRIPGLSNGTRVRFTFDNVSSASASKLYIEGVFNLRSRTLTDVKYYGMTSTSGSTVVGVSDGIFVTFNFNGIQTKDNSMLSKNKIKEWYYTSSSTWQINSEFDPDQQPDIQTESSSALIMLVLDCSSSLGDQFSTAKTNAKSFINTLYNSYKKPSSCTVHGDSEGHYYVDLGLSVKWATFNVGADNPEDYGEYYAWGETETKSTYAWSTYKYCYGTQETFTKYCFNSYYGYNGFTDTKTILDPDDDVAHVKWGGNWRMPTIDEFMELINNCTWTWTTQNGVKGSKVTSNKPGYEGCSIFLPAAGDYSGTSLSRAGEHGTYWSSSLHVFEDFQDLNDPREGRTCGVSEYIPNGDGGAFRYLGCSVRPVCP